MAEDQKEGPEQSDVPTFDTDQDVMSFRQRIRNKVKKDLDDYEENRRKAAERARSTYM